MNDIQIDMSDFTCTGVAPVAEELPELQIHIDGSCLPNPGGDMRGGVYIKYKGRKIWDAAGVLLGRNGTNNMAEICIALYALTALQRIQEKHPEYNVPSVIISDSMLIVSAINKGGAKSKALDDKVEEFLQLRDKMENKPIVVWRRREENSKADSRSR